MVRVKICGITNLEDARLAVEAGADALGFIFVENTPRFVTPEQVAPIVRWLPPFVTPVGVFWDHPSGHVKAVAEACGHFGKFGGRFVPETLMAPLIELEKAYAAARRDRKFQARLNALLADYAGRPTPLYHAARLSEHCGGARIWLKREDLCHTGAHKVNNVLGQALLAVRMKKPRVIAETGAGQHGVATATAAALFGLECEVYMGTEDIERQALNVFR